MDHLEFGRPNDSDMELAEQVVDLHNDWTQPLYHVCPVPSQGGPRSISIVGSISKSMGYFRVTEETLGANVNEFRGSDGAREPEPG